jgi:hypothetical protein
LEELLMGLLSIGISDADCRPVIDHAVAALLYSDTCRSIAVRCLRELRACETDPVEHYSAAFDALAQHPAQFAELTSDWLLHVDTSFRAIRSLMSRCSIGAGPIGLSESMFREQSTDRRVKAARRLLGLSFSGPTLCRFASVVAEMTLLGPERLRLADQMLRHLFAEFPGATEEFLRSKLAQLDRASPESAMYRAIYADVLRWRRVLTKLPARRELRPTDAQLQVLSTRARRTNREITRSARDLSVFAGFVKSVHLAQGRKFASHSQRGSSRVTHMAEKVHSVELPSSERADPMRGMLERHSLLLDAR